MRNNYEPILKTVGIVSSISVLVALLYPEQFSNFNIPGLIALSVIYGSILFGITSVINYGFKSSKVNSVSLSIGGFTVLNVGWIVLSYFEFFSPLPSIIVLAVYLGILAIPVIILLDAIQNGFSSVSLGVILLLVVLVLDFTLLYVVINLLLLSFIYSEIVG